MIGYILDKLGYKPTMINGGLLLNYADMPGIPNIICNNGDTCVIEADESDGSIEKYSPYIAVINNISIDHKPIPELQNYLEILHPAPNTELSSMPTARLVPTLKIHKNRTCLFPSSTPMPIFMQ